MFAFIGGVALAAAAPATPPAADPCAGDPHCRQASAAELFAAADALAAQGDLAGAENILQVLTQDANSDLRAEARFRLAAVREKMGNLTGAADALRALLAEKPKAQRARLELSRILAEQGRDSEARRELNRAQSAGLPPEVMRTVRRFSTALNSLKRRGASIELVAAADSNVNRSTADKYLDTVIAPFELDPNARKQSGLGLSAGAEAWSRNALIGNAIFLTRAGFQGDFFPGKGQFNDLQLALSSGPELTTPIGRLRPALAFERRWYGGRAYSLGYGIGVNWVVHASAASQLQLDGSAVRQWIAGNAVLDGERYLLSAAWDRAFTPETSLRVTLRGAMLEAKAVPESLRQAGADLLVAHVFGFGTTFGQAGYTHTWGIAPLALFGRTRRDDRFDLGAGLIAHALEFGGFDPLVRLTYSKARSNIGLYSWQRVRAEVGVTRAF